MQEEHFEAQVSEVMKTLTNELLQHRPPWLLKGPT